MIDYVSLNRLNQLFVKFGSYPNSEVKLVYLLNKKRELKYKKIQSSYSYFEDFKEKKYTVVYRNGFFPEYYFGWKICKYNYIKKITFYNPRFHLKQSYEGKSSTRTYYVFNDQEYLMSEKFHRNNLIGRKEDLPSIFYYEHMEKSLIGKITSEFFYKNGKLHREDKPAGIHYEYINNEKIISCLEYFRDGKPHRNESDKPAYISYCFKRNTFEKILKEEIYYKDGKIHRDNDLPAWYQNITFFVDCDFGTIQKYYYNNDKLHREGNPAKIGHFVDNGRISNLGYYKDDELHREGKPAIIIYKKDSTIKYEEFYENGKIITKRPATKRNNFHQGRPLGTLGDRD